MKPLVQRYGSPSKEAEIRITAYLLRPDTLTADRIPWNDEQAARLISGCESLIESLEEYRRPGGAICNAPDGPL